METFLRASIDLDTPNSFLATKFTKELYERLWSLHRIMDWFCRYISTPSNFFKSHTPLGALCGLRWRPAFHYRHFSSISRVYYSNFIHYRWRSDVKLVLINAIWALVLFQFKWMGNDVKIKWVIEISCLINWILVSCFFFIKN